MAQEQTKGTDETAEGFVLVPASELKELRTLEGALRRERNVLKAQCLLSLNEVEVSGGLSVIAFRSEHEEGPEGTDMIDVGKARSLKPNGMKSNVA